MGCQVTLRKVRFIVRKVLYVISFASHAIHCSPLNLAIQHPFQFIVQLVLLCRVFCLIFFFYFNSILLVLYVNSCIVVLCNFTEIYVFHLRLLQTYKFNSFANRCSSILMCMLSQKPEHRSIDLVSVEILNIVWVSLM